MIYKKKFGQNFLSDKNLLEGICNDADLNGDDLVLEIGAGAGALTKVLSKRAKSVVSYEIDTDLKPTLEDLSLPNVKFVFGDIMDYDMTEIEKDFDGEYKLVANLPYYITSPIIFKFLGQAKKLKSLTIMVQKEVAERIIALPGGKDYGVLSVMTAFYGRAKYMRTVKKEMFYPMPKVDSAVVNITLSRQNLDGEKFFRFIQASFSMRRKTLKNNLIHAGFKDIDKILSPDILSLRPEKLSLEQFIEIFNLLKK